MPGCGSKQIDGQYCLDVFETGDRQGQIIELAGVRDELLELVSMDLHALSLQGKHHPPPGLADLKNQDRVYDLCKRRLKNLGNVLRRWLGLDFPESVQHKDTVRAGKPRQNLVDPKL